MGKAIAISILLIIALSSLILLVSDVKLTGKAVESIETYTYTKAVCNSSNSCQDYLVTCKNNKVEKTSPITGAVTYHSEDWKDPRENKTISCDD